MQFRNPRHRRLLAAIVFIVSAGVLSLSTEAKLAQYEAFGHSLTHLSKEAKFAEAKADRMTAVAPEPAPAILAGAQESETHFAAPDLPRPRLWRPHNPLYFRPPPSPIA